MIRRGSIRSAIGALAALALLGSVETRAAIVLEDFSTAGVLMGQTGGSGWGSNAWGASTGASQLTSRLRAVSGTNLSYSTGGYSITQSGSGYTYSDYNGFRGINRFAGNDLTGTVWFSALVQAASTSDHIGIQFNNHVRLPYTGSDYAQGPWQIELTGTNVNVYYNNSTTTPTATAVTNAAVGQAHLILGRWTIDNTAGANDRLEVWVDPADLLNLGTANFDAATANLGDNLYLVGVFGWGSSNVGLNTDNKGFIDALRVSDSATGLADVTGVPEPSTLLLLLPAVFLGRRRRTQ